MQIAQPGKKSAKKAHKEPTSNLWWVSFAPNVRSKTVAALAISLDFALIFGRKQPQLRTEIYFAGYSISGRIKAINVSVFWPNR